LFLAKTPTITTARRRPVTIEIISPISALSMFLSLVDEDLGRRLLLWK
jgi:hypothetical protein